MKLFKRLEPVAQERLAWVMLVLAMLIYSVEMSIQSVLRYTTFKATAFDLGNMDQVLWNTVHGRFFQFTNQAIDWYGPPNRLAIHVEPIMLLVSLLYAIHADPRVLLVFQTLVLAAGAPAVFLLSRRYLPAWPMLAVAMSIAYLLSPAVLGINIFDFHPDSIATPLFLYAILAVAYRRYVAFLILCFFACACKEDMPLAVALFGILLIWKYRLPRLGLTLFFGGALWSFIAFKFIIPHFYPGLLANNFWYRYAPLGSTPGDAIVNLLIHPWIVWSMLVTLPRLYYIFSLLRSTGFIAILAPEWLLPALPKFASNILSVSTPFNYSGVFHYNAAIVPFVILASIHGIRRFILIWQGWSRQDMREEERKLLLGAPTPDTEVPGPYPLDWLPVRVQKLILRITSFCQRWSERIRVRLMRLVRLPWWQSQWHNLGEHMYPFTKKVSSRRLQWVLCVWIIFSLGINYFIAFPQLNSFWADHWPGTREAQIQHLIDLIPPDASVSASDDLNPHLSERRLVTVFPSYCMDATCKQTVDYIIVDLNSPTLGDRATAIRTLNALSGSKGQFQLIQRAYGVELFKRRST